MDDVEDTLKNQRYGLRGGPRRRGARELVESSRDQQGREEARKAGGGGEGPLARAGGGGGGLHRTSPEYGMRRKRIPMPRLKSRYCKLES